MRRLLDPTTTGPGCSAVTVQAQLAGQEAPASRTRTPGGGAGLSHRGGRIGGFGQGPGDRQAGSSISTEPGVLSQPFPFYQTHGGLPGHQGKFFLAPFYQKCIICAKSFLPPTGRSPGRAARANIPSGCPPARCSSAGSRRRTPVTSGEEAEARLRHPPGESRHSKGTSGWPFPSILPRDRSQG